MHRNMKTNGSGTLLLVIMTITLTGLTTSNGAKAAPAQGAYYTRAYTNLFSSLLGKSDQETKSRLNEIFDQLFYGNDSTQRVYYPVGSDMAYIEDIGDGDVRTEGMSYGMMIAVQMDKKDAFDRLWKWVKTYMQINSGPHQGYFAWHCRTDGRVLALDAASDGEEWFVMSLFFASARWGNGTGLYDYKSQAQAILNTMLHKDSEPGHGSVTDMFNKQVKLVVFVPTSRASGFTDPSYQLPHYYELWARWASKDNDFWCDAAVASRELLRRAANAKTGLFPDYSSFDGTPVIGRIGGHGDFRFDAWRVAMNVAVDWSWFEKDDWEVEQSNRLLDFFRSEGYYGNQYNLKGNKLSDDHSPGLVAMNAVVALAATTNSRKAFVRESGYSHSDRSVQVL